MYKRLNYENFYKTYLVEPACECDHIGSQTVFLFPVPSTAGQFLQIRKSNQFHYQRNDQWQYRTFGLEPVTGDHLCQYEIPSE